MEKTALWDKVWPLGLLFRKVCSPPYSIIALLATNFFSTAGLRLSSKAEAQIDSYKLAIGFAAANSIFSAWAYFLVENKKEARTIEEISSNISGDEIEEESQFGREEENYQDRQYSEDDLSKLGEMASEEKPQRFSATDAHVTFQPRQKKIDNRDIENGSTTSLNEGNSLSPEIPIRTSRPSSRNSSILSVQNDDETDDHSELYEFKDANQMRGRRFLLLISLFGGMITLLITSLFFNIHDGSPARLPLIALFIMIFTMFYSVGAGAIPFLYCAEVFPNEGRGTMSLPPQLLSTFDVPYGADMQVIKQKLECHGPLSGTSRVHAHSYLHFYTLSPQ